MTRIRVGDIHLNLVVEGSGPPLVLLHGFTGSARSWDHLAPDFAAHFTVYRVDLLGHGRSDRPDDATRYRVEACVADILGLCDALDLDRFHLLGYSMGGRVALRLALDASHRVQSLILESVSAGIESTTDRRERIRADEALASMLQERGLKVFVDYWEHIPLFRSQAGLPPEVRRLLRRQRLDNDALGLAGSLRGLGAGVAEPQWDRLPGLAVPSLLIVGDLDEKYRGLGERMLNLLPCCRLAIIPGAGHAAHLEQPRLFLDAAIPFLLRHEVAPLWGDPITSRANS